MAIQNFDQLNSIATTWYSRMNASKQEKDKRVDLSLIFADVILMFLDMVVAKTILKDEFKAKLAERLEIIASKEIGKDNVAYINDWSKVEAEKIAENTFNNIDSEPTEDTEENIAPETMTFEEFGVTIPKKDYWTSDIRGILIGIECASAVSNYRELYDALEKGHTRKVWITEADDKVRPTHQSVDHTDIPINDLFVVGSSYLLFPGDVSNGAEEKEVDNCRCHLETY